MPATTAEFLSRFATLNHHDALLVDIGGEVPLPVRGRHAANASTLVLNFHGSIDRSKREYPAFLYYRADICRHAHQLAFADPSLALHDELTNGHLPYSHMSHTRIVGRVISLPTDRY